MFSIKRALGLPGLEGLGTSLCWGFGVWGLGLEGLGSKSF